MLAPTIGMNAPRKTSAASGNANGTSRMTSARPMPTASMKATRTVARTYEPSVAQEASPASESDQRALTGNSRTMKRQILRPSRRKKNVANSTSSAPVSTSASVVAVATPVAVSDDVFALTQFCADVDGLVDLLVGEVQRTGARPVLDLPDAVAGVVGQLRHAVDELVDHQRQRAGDRGQAADQHQEGGQRRAAA